MENESGTGGGKYLSHTEYNELFGYEENDRDKKMLKKDYRALKNFHGKIKFKNLLGKYPFHHQPFPIDFYLTSANQFEDTLK